jgi:hypothetical protein
MKIAEMLACLADMLTKGDFEGYRLRIAHLYAYEPELFEAIVLHHKAELERDARESDLDCLEDMTEDERKVAFAKLADPEGYKRRYSSIEGLVALRPKALRALESGGRIKAARKATG